MRISGLSDYDYVKLVATWFYNVEDKFNCEEQKSKYLMMPESEKKINDYMLARGCLGKSELSGVVYDKPTNRPRYQQDEVCFYNCFCNFIDPSTNFLLNLFWYFDKGILPFQGAITEQPAKIIDVFNVFTHLKHEKQKDDAKKQKNKKG